MLAGESLKPRIKPLWDENVRYCMLNRVHTNNGGADGWLRYLSASTKESGRERHRWRSFRCGGAALHGLIGCRVGRRRRALGKGHSGRRVKTKGARAITLFPGLHRRKEPSLDSSRLCPTTRVRFMKRLNPDSLRADPSPRPHSSHCHDVLRCYYST